MRSHIVVAVVSLFALFMGVAANVSYGEVLATDMLYTDGTVSQLEDDDWESVDECVNANNTVEVGEYFYGMFAITDVQNPLTQVKQPRQSEMFAGVFVAEVAAIVDLNSGFGNPKLIQLKPATDPTAWTDFGLSAPTDPGTMAVVYSDPDGPQSMVNPKAGSVNASLATAVNGTKLWEIGFTGTNGEAAAGEYWNAYVFSFTGGNPLALDPAQLSLLQYNANLNVTETAAGIGLVAHDFLNRGNGDVQVQFTGGMESFAAGDFQIRTDSDFYVQAVPEPGSLALMLFGALALAGAWWKRRR